MSSPRISAARASASSGPSASLTPPAFPRPPVSTCAFTTTGPPSSSAAARASAGVVASRPRETGIPKRASSSFPWCSYRSTAGPIYAGRRERILSGDAVRRPAHARPDRLRARSSSCCSRSTSREHDYWGTAVFCVAMSTDWFDGRIARRSGRTTSFGSLLDPVADKVLVLATLVVLLDEGVFPAWMVAAIVARELLISGLRLAALERGVVIAARDLGKLKTWSQAIAAAAGGLAAAGAWSDRVSWWLLLLAVALTWVSGLDYARSAPSVLRGRAVASLLNPAADTLGCLGRPLHHLAVRRARRAARLLLLALCPSDGRRGRGAARRARGRRRSALRIGARRATTAVVLAFARPGTKIALAEGAYFGTSVLFRTLGSWGLELVEYDQTGPPPADADIVWVESPANPIAHRAGLGGCCGRTRRSSSATRRSRRRSTCGRSTRAPTSSSTRRRSS